MNSDSLTSLNPPSPPFSLRRRNSQCLQPPQYWHSLKNSIPILQGTLAKTGAFPSDSALERSEEGMLQSYVRFLWVTRWILGVEGVGRLGSGA